MIIATLLALVTSSATAEWYGPQKVNFDLTVLGSPYDAQNNDVQVRFTVGHHAEQRFAYYDGNHWSAVLLTQTPGIYHAQVMLNGAAVAKLPGNLDVNTKYTKGFIRVDQPARMFSFDDGTPYWPIGNSLGWQDPSCPPMTQQLAMMGAAGMNWSRIWACNFDGRNPWWPKDHKLEGQDLDQGAFDKWDALVDAASKAGVHFQWVLFHHGEFATMVDPMWSSNPWNKANGGFLASPVDFFTSDGAKARVKNYIRYVVARYGHENAICSWELFNEVENTDAARLGHWDVIGDWHREMAGYLREIDPYHHLITSSSEMRPEITSSLDYYQPHGYPSNVGAMIEGSTVPTDRPFFYGECGLGTNPPSPAAQRACVRDAIWSSLLSGHSGAAEYWYWDWMVKDSLFDEYSKAHSVIEAIGITPGPDDKPVHVDLETGARSDLIFNPGIGWGPSKRLAFTFPADDSGKAMGQLSSFLQGTNHKDMGNQVQFNFTAPMAGKVAIKVGMVARAGAGLVVNLDGSQMLDQHWSAGDRDRPIDQVFSFDCGQGPHHLIVSNPGSDWLTVQSYEFAGLGHGADISAARTSKGLIARIHKSASGATTVELKSLPLEDGNYLLRIWNLDSVGSEEVAATVKSGQLVQPLNLSGSDLILGMERR